MNKFLVVFDTNVIVSALLSEDVDSNEVKLMEYINLNIIKPIFSDDIMKEYKEVLSRKEFEFNKKSVGDMIARFKKKGILVKPHKLDINFKDISDLKFYEVVMEKKDKNAKLVTGNIKDFPIDKRIVTPREMLKLIEK
ncbi:MAG: putative toxin-antitoxin system toxin component, PIN family [Lachnospiraceae bacterium]|nr:putative toxin-antitoxin system toxin component, PIN family [Lachnospiraceae bacterium]